MFVLVLVLLRHVAAALMLIVGVLIVIGDKSAGAFAFGIILLFLGTLLAIGLFKDKIAEAIKNASGAG